MKVVSVDTTAGGTEIVPAGYRNFIHIQPIGADLYVKYDGSATALTTSNGLKISDGAYLNLNNDGSKHLFNHPIIGITASGTATVRVQGVD